MNAKTFSLTRIMVLVTIALALGLGVAAQSRAAYEPCGPTDASGRPIDSPKWRENIARWESCEKIFYAQMAREDQTHRHGIENRQATLEEVNAGRQFSLADRKMALYERRQIECFDMEKARLGLEVFQTALRAFGSNRQQGYGYVPYYSTSSSCYY